jgi:chromate transport protein ChrA
MLVLAALATRKWRRRNPILDSRTDSKFTMSMSITGSLIGMIVALLVGTIGADRSGNLEGGSVWAYLVQLGDMLLIGILLGTAHIIRSSNGTRSARWWTIIPMVAAVLLGIAGNSKQQIYAPLLLWIMCCAIYRYKFNRLQVGGLITAGLFGVLVVFPVVQYSRAYVREGNLTNRTELVWNFMRDHSISDIRESYTADEELKEEGGHQGYYFYYGQDEQVLDRVSLISVDDAVVTYTLQTGPGGYDAFTQEFISMVPRAFFPDKDRYLTIPVVNVLGRETGILGPSDETTYIAFSLFGPTYYMGEWWAITAVTFICMALFFTVVDSFYGDARTSLYALIAIGGNLHGAAELILPVVFGSMLHLCVLGSFTIWLLRKMAVGMQVFIQNYSWFEKSPGNLAPRRTFIVAQPVNLAVTPTPSGFPAA